MFFQRMDSRFSNAELARKYGITTVTLHNTFKSLTGMGPQKLFRLLRLNLIHSELLRADPHTATTSTIATQWGFPHQGRFSQSYRELFGELPSTTLKKKPSIIGISPDCFFHEIDSIICFVTSQSTSPLRFFMFSDRQGGENPCKIPAKTCVSIP
jgi:AraC-like DNA-binding protein